MCSVSAILLTNNRPVEVFVRALNSVVSQTHVVSEIIVVDTAEDSVLSADKERLLVQIAGGKKHLYIRTWPVSIGGYGRNVGVAACTGEFISFLDDDDEWSKEKIEFQVARMTPEIGIVHSDYYVEDGEGNLLPFSETIKPTPNMILCGNYIGCTSMPLIRKACFDEVGGFDESFVSAQEWDLWVNMMDVCKTIFVDGCAGIKHHSLCSITANSKKRKKGWFQFLFKHRGKYLENISCLEFAISTYIFEMLRGKYFFSATIGIVVKVATIVSCRILNKDLIKRP